MVSQLLTGYDIDPEKVAEHLHTLANDIEDGNVHLEAVADSISAPHDDVLEYSTELDFYITEDAAFRNLIELSAI